MPMHEVIGKHTFVNGNLNQRLNYSDTIYEFAVRYNIILLTEYIILIIRI